MNNSYNVEVIVVFESGNKDETDNKDETEYV